MRNDDIHKIDADTDALPPPTGVATSRGYTREVALESVGAGWAALIHFLFDRIERPRDVSGRPPEPLPVHVAQVKEKFGGLRFYYDWLNSETTKSDDAQSFDSAVQFAETFSFYMCERCGLLGRPRNGGWVRTLCDAHAAEKGRATAP